MIPNPATNPNAGIPLAKKRALDQKIEHAVVDYHQTDGEERCDRCIHYVLDENGNGCEIVEEPIHPNGWCRLFKLPQSPAGDVEMGHVKSVKIKFDEKALDQALALGIDQESVREFDTDGRMRVSKAHISKANICPYKGAEIPDWEGLGLDPNKVYMLLRDPEELEKAADSFNGVQLLRKHVPVSAEDHRAWDVVGTVGTDCEFNDPYLDNSLVIWAADAIGDVESEAKRQLSAGYHYVADMTPGNFNGKPYDGVMRDIVGNHVALVEQGRAGSDVMVGDSMESLMPEPAKKLPTRFAKLALDTTLTALPPLVKGAKIDLFPIFSPLTRTGFKAKPVQLALDKALKGRLAKDTTLDDVNGLLDRLEHADNPKSLDESVSGPQHRAMAAAAKGEGNLDIPKGVGQEFLDADKGKTFNDADPSVNLSHFLAGKGVSEDDIRTACDIAFPKAQDALAVTEGGDNGPDKTPGSPSDKGTIMSKEGEHAHVGGKDEKDDEFANARADLTDKAKEKETGEDAMPKDMVTKQAMDAAIEKATKAVRDSVLKSQREIRMALDEVRPYVGELPSSLAFDSAADVFKQALKIKDPELGLDDIHPTAFRHILLKGYQPAGARENRGNGAALGMDEKARQSFDERFPNAKRIGVAA